MLPTVVRMGGIWLKNLAHFNLSILPSQTAIFSWKLILSSDFPLRKSFTRLWKTDAVLMQPKQSVLKWFSTTNVYFSVSIERKEQDISDNLSVTILTFGFPHFETCPTLWPPPAPHLLMPASNLNSQFKYPPAICKGGCSLWL